MADSEVWASTAAIDAVLHPESSHHSKGHRKNMHVRGSSDTVDWGWTFARVTDGALDGKTGVTIVVDDPESEFHRQKVDLPARVIEGGAVVVANYHGEDHGGGGGGGGGATNFNGGEACGYPDDLITLTHLHEPAVVHCLRKRYERDMIYTNTGPILIALNPFKSCKALYSDKIMKLYWERGELQATNIASSSAGGGDDGEEKKDDEGGGPEEIPGESLPAHVYELADGTYRSMMRDMEEVGDGHAKIGPGGTTCNQSILISGESGAGKTFTTKVIMGYLATLSERQVTADPLWEPPGARKKRQRKSPSHKDSGKENSIGIEQQVLRCNPILESFGNARTIRNDNSSRFGKFIELHFDTRGTLVGASIETYLLEKVRLIGQAEGERNYHVFYEMLAGMSNELLEEYFLDKHSAEDFKITSCSGTYGRRDGVEDVDTFGDLADALAVMGFSDTRQKDIFSIASSVLHLGNLTVNPIAGGEECEIDTGNEHLGPITELLGVTKENLNQAICYLEIEAGGCSYARCLSPEKARRGLEALMKATYSAMFDFIVRTINASITVGRGGGGGGGSRRLHRVGNHSVIGVLDIFGFESFEQNSFEQLCINYCNESLQQQFNLFVLKNEQDEYKLESIQWSFISFPDNQDVLDLIWKKGCGVLNILDDQCRAPGTTDKTFANYLYQNLINKPRFEANFRQVGARQFAIHHYAGLVEYDTDGFVEKNKDELPREATDLLLSSSSAFVKELAAIISPVLPLPKEEQPAKRSAKGGEKKKRFTVGGHFASQLQSLRAKIDLTSPHYVRCLKPNARLVADNFDPLMIVEQLRCAGVVEAVRVSRVGYPQRYSHYQFISRYWTLESNEMSKAAKMGLRKNPVAALVDAIARKILILENKSNQSLPASTAESPANKSKQLNSQGNGKVDLLAMGIQVGKTKVFLQRKAFDIIEKMRKEHVSSAIKVQAIGRGYIYRHNYQEKRKSYLQLQRWCRILSAKRKVQIAREHFNAQRIQTSFRQYSARTAYLCVLEVAQWCQRRQRGAQVRARHGTLHSLRHSLIVIQCAVRVRQSRRNFHKRKEEAKALQNSAKKRETVRQRMEHERMEKEQTELLASIKKETTGDSAANIKLDEVTRLRIKELIAETRLPRGADEFLSSYYFGREEILLRKLQKMKAKQDGNAILIPAIQELVNAVDSPVSVDDLLSAYAGREEVLLRNLKKLKLRQDVGKPKLVAQIAKLVRETNSPQGTDALLAHYVGREEDLLRYLKKFKANQERDAAATAVAKEAGPASPRRQNGVLR